MFGGVGIYSYLCGAVCSQKRLQRKQKGRPGMAADETPRGRDEIASYEKGDAEVGVDGADGAIIVNEIIMKIK